VIPLVLPRMFHDDFPGVLMLPPYSEHLMRDVGALALERRMVRTALAANLVFTM
jgi:hypothetical protein